MNNNKFSSKDYIAVVIYSLLAYVLMSIMGLIFSFVMPFAWPILSGISLFPVAIIYLLMAYRIGKKGAIFGFSLVLGLIYSLMGLIIMLPYSILFGIIAEVSLLGNYKNYRSFVRQTFAYAIYVVALGFGDMFSLYVLGRSAYKKMQYSSTLIDKMQSFATNPLWIVANLLTTLLLAILGCWIGEKLLNKHFRKAGYLDNHDKN
ncbi:MptD family putative ECF transporter S component [Leuconostoc sp. JNUCC 76]